MATARHGIWISMKGRMWALVVTNVGTNVGTNLRYLWSSVEYCSWTLSTWWRCCSVSGSALNSSTRQISSSIVWSNWF